MGFSSMIVLKIYFLKPFFKIAHIFECRLQKVGRVALSIYQYVRCWSFFWFDFAEHFTSCISFKPSAKTPATILWKGWTWVTSGMWVLFTWPSLADFGMLFCFLNIKIRNMLFISWYERAIYKIKNFQGAFLSIVSINNFNTFLKLFDTSPPCHGF